jgi:hypothetical protein
MILIIGHNWGCVNFRGEDVYFRFNIPRGFGDIPETDMFRQTSVEEIVNMWLMTQEAKRNIRRCALALRVTVGVWDVFYGISLTAVAFSLSNQLLWRTRADFSQPYLSVTIVSASG